MGIFLMIAVLALVVIAFLPRMTKVDKKLVFIETYSFHPALKIKLQKKHPKLADEQLETIFKGLRDYFALCKEANGNMVAMPSRIVDEAWHEFILFTRHYQLFCHKAFGHFLHHNPAEALSTMSQIQNALNLARDLAWKKGQNESDGSIPLLFRIDAELAIPSGMKYGSNCELIGDFDPSNDVADADVYNCC